MRFRTMPHIAALAFVLAACSANPDRSPVPFADVNTAEINGMEHIRFWGDARPQNLAAALGEINTQTRKHRPKMLKRGAKRTFLAISGGGSDGAFGAGLLAGWTQHGDRPEFDVVTGVSTGALSAPFAFLGPAYDGKLKEIYTAYSTEDLLTAQPLDAVFGGSAVADNTKLRELVARYIDDATLARIAAEHRRGRRLFVGTTNLDAQRPVIWDMGAIAASGHSDAKRVFQDVLVASAAIPGVFPPMNIDVTVDGRRFDEMHVDGGTTAQVFFAPIQLLSGPERKQIKRQLSGTLYVIRNVKVTPEWQAVQPRLVDISSRSLSTLMKNQAGGDLFKAYYLARELGIKYRLAAVPATFTMKSTEPFDQAYMTALFNVGFEQAKDGYDWGPTPPGL